MSPFIRKLRHGARLAESDEAVLARFAQPTRRVERGDIMRDGSEPRFVLLVLEGWACRYKLLENGKRQITAVLLPGDLCAPFGALPSFMDHSLAALTPVVLACVTPGDIRDAAQANSRIEEALWWDLLLSDAIGREHISSLGRRSAAERLGHFLCEVHLRLEAVGLADRLSFGMPLTQADLADLFGLSAVQVNRSLQDLRGAGLLSLRDRRATIRDLRALRELSMFDPAYLRFSGADRV